MIKYETYKSNLDLRDKNGIEPIKVTKSVIYRSDIGKLHGFENEHDTVDNNTDINRPLAAAVIGTRNTNAPFDFSHSEFHHAWTNIDAQEIYMMRKPTCYLILSKPGIDVHTLGESIAKKYNCIHLCPKNVILDEIEQSSTTGKCIDFNIRQNKVLKSDNILEIMKQKIESASVKYRGYVMSDLPVVTSSRDIKSITQPLFSEEALSVTEELFSDILTTIKKRKPKRKRNLSIHSSMSSGIEENMEEEMPEEEQVEEERSVGDEEVEEPVELPKFILDPCSNAILSKRLCVTTHKSLILKQLHEIFNWKMQPSVIIYITCPDMDAVTIKRHSYLNYPSLNNVFEPFVTNSNYEERWPPKYTLSAYNAPFDIHSFSPKYNCRQPINFVAESKQQICNYNKDVLPYLENKLQEFQPKFVIKLDGRTSVHHMIHNLSENLITLSIKPILIPEPLYLEEPPEDMEEFWNLVEESNVIHSDSMVFNRYASPWYNRCPVELKNGQAIVGKPKLAVSLFQHVYLLSSLDSMISFCRNPQPYIKLEYLEPTCRIIVLGTKLAGKTMVAKCLSWIFDAPVICFSSILKEEQKKKRDVYEKNILSEITTSIEDDRLSKWETIENERIANLNSWCDKEYVVLKKYIDVIRGEKFDETGIPDPKFLERVENLRKKLSYLPVLDDIVECESILNNKALAQYAPVELFAVHPKPTAIPLIGDEDVDKAIAEYIVANDMQKDIEPTPEEIMNEVILKISSLDEETQKSSCFEHKYGKYVIDGFPSNLDYWSHLYDGNLMPDNTIALIENRELEPELLEYYVSIEKSCKKPEERLLQASDPLIKLKLQSKSLPTFTVDDAEIIIYSIILNIFDSLGDIPLQGDDNEGEAIMTSESIEKFREDWDSIKLKIEEKFKSFIEIELESLSDIEVIDEVFLQLRRSYSTSCRIIEDELDVQDDEEDDIPMNTVTYNESRFLGDTNIYCPIAYYKYGVLWEGKPEFTRKYDNKMYYFCKEEYTEIFQNDMTKYQSFNTPNKYLPPMRICVIGCVGSGKSTISKLIAKELGLFYVDIEELIQNVLMPKHFKKVGRKYENPFIDTPIDDEAVTEYQIDEANENFVTDILSNESELRQMIYNYIEKGAPIISVLMQKIIRTVWFEEPFHSRGFVLDGYPKLPTDCEDMLSCFCIPDVIIELESDVETTTNRLAPNMFKTWKQQLNEAKNKAKMKHNIEKQNWSDFITKNVVAKLIILDIIDSIIPSDTLLEDALDPIAAASTIMDAHSAGSLNIDPILFIVYNEMADEHPQPVDENVWDKPEDVQEKITSRLEGIYEIDSENIQSLKDVIMEQKIKVFTVNGTNSLNKVFRKVLLKLSNLRNRGQSFFEQTYYINLDIAEILIANGYYFLSKFRRMCPVYIFENPNAIINPYKVWKSKEKVYAIANRCYIYFIFGEENVRKFRSDPIKYIQNDNIISYNHSTLRIGVIGPPKSGKSRLAAKLARKHDLICLSKGMAIRSVLENMPWTELAIRMKKSLLIGECIDTRLIIDAIQTVAIDCRTVTQGFVADGFPESPLEVTELSKIGLYPVILFDIVTPRNRIKENSQNEIYFDILKRKPPYSYPFIEYRFDKWNEKCRIARDWINNDYKNIHTLDGSCSKWQCFDVATKYVDEFIPKIHYYLQNVNSKIVSVEGMCISEKTFKERMSNYKDLCPVCLSTNRLRHSGYPIDRKGVVQYNNKFYWICEEHMDMVLKQPNKYIVLSKIINAISIPEIPAVVKTVNMSLVYENGICIVTYADNLPAQKIERGYQKFAASYSKKIYLFCSEKCLQKFLEKPHIYFDIFVFRYAKSFPEISVNKLPHLGYLEQSLGEMITKACCALNVVRPKYPGLSTSLSGLLYLALYLKINNPLEKSEIIKKYTIVQTTYLARCKLMINVGLRLRSMDNPFAHYPNCCGDSKSVYSGTVNATSVQSEVSSRNAICEQ